MAIDVSLPSQVISAPSTNTSSSSTSTGSMGSGSGATLAGNFQTFLTLLTTQLQNQNPLDPLDTNQFTQQLVQFAQVEQQLKQNDQLKSLIDLQKTSQATQALNLVGATVVVDGTSAAYKDGMATWTLTTPKDVRATVSVVNASGQTVYSGTYNLNAGNHNFVWDGKGNDGVQWPEGTYKVSIKAVDADGQAVTMSADSKGVIDSVDLTSTPPLLIINGESITLDQIKRVVRPTSSGSDTTI
jgi:flagellar basal-body rod modification protein FlgD